MRVLRRQRGQSGQMLRVMLFKLGAHVRIELLVVLNVGNVLFERVQRFQQVQHAKLVGFALNDAVVRVVVRIFIGDSGLVQQGLVVQQRHEGEQHGLNGLAPAPLLTAPRVQNADAHLARFLHFGVHARLSVVG